MLINQLTFTRFVAAIVIVFFHFAVNNQVYPFYISEWQWLADIIKVGNLPVLYFFILSGFILTINYPNRARINKPGDFYWKRFSRIYPIYFISFILSVLFVKNISLLDYILNITLLNGWYWPSNMLNPAAWSLSAEVFFYILFPFVLLKYFTLTGKQLIGLWGLHILILYLMQYKYGDFYLPHYLPTPIETMLNFSLGIVGGRLFVIYNEYFKKKNIWFSTLILPAIIVQCSLIIYFKYTWFDGFWIFSSLFLIMILSLSSFSQIWLLTRLLTNPVLLKLGEISYSIFILQFPIMYIYNFSLAKLHIGLKTTTHFYSYLILLISASYLTYTFIEDPVRKKMYKYRSKSNKPQVVNV